MRFLLKTSDVCATATNWVATAMAIVMMVSLVLQIFFRYVVGRALIWSEELALFLFTWIILLIMSSGVREGLHVGMTLLRDTLPRRARRTLDAATVLASLIFGISLAWAGHQYLDATLGQVSAAVRYPIEALHSATLVSGVLIILHACARLIEVIGNTGNERAGDKPG